MVHHMMISLDSNSRNVNTFKEWCLHRHQTGEIVPGRIVASLEEAKPLLTSYGYYVMQNWRESPCHFDTTGPIGCFLAHRDAWKICVSRNEHVWIFEEGVYTYDTTMFDKIDRVHSTTDLILGHTVPLLRMWIQNTVHTQTIDSMLMSIDKIYFGTRCYRLSPSFAASLLQNSLTFDTHVDTFICTEAIRYADEFKVARTYKNIVSAMSSGAINHSVDKNQLMLFSLLVGLLLCAGGAIYLLRIRHRRCLVGQTSPDSTIV
jgi:GR25 family glycosyltransferase involved in LPS biosynthesis